MSLGWQRSLKDNRNDQETGLSPHLIQATAKAQMDDRLRFAERRRLVAQTRIRGAASAAVPSGRGLGVRSLRAVFG